MPLAIDLYAGLGGWAEGLLAEGWGVIGFDIERHQYGEHRYPATLVIQDVLTLHGAQFRDAGLIVASPPCQEYSYMAMPWTRAKAIAVEYRSGQRDVAKLNELFDACFRIQREACEAAGRHIPLIVENVRGAIPWVGRSRWNFGSYYLWGDVPALMPFVPARTTMKTAFSHQPGGMTIWDAYREREARKVLGFRFDGSGGSFQTASVNGTKGVPHRTAGHWTNPAERNGVKHHGSGEVWFDTGPASLPSSSPRRKAASAMIAKIPLPLSRHIARVFLSMQERAA